MTGSSSNKRPPLFLRSLLGFFAALGSTNAFPAVSTRAFHTSPASDDRPKLILISGSPGTGKSTFGMSVALDQGILKCISTDTVRAVMRSFVAKEVSPALHRSSYATAFEGDDPVRSWKETCTVLDASVKGLVEDAMQRKVSLVVEGVHVMPSKYLVDRWEENGGVAIGCLLRISNPEKHKKLLRRRGFMTGQVENEQKKLSAFDRIRAIQDEMMRLADESNWIQIEQRTEMDPLDMIASKLYAVPSEEIPFKDAFVEQMIADGVEFEQVQTEHGHQELEDELHRVEEAVQEG